MAHILWWSVRHHLSYALGRCSTTEEDRRHRMLIAWKRFLHVRRVLQVPVDVLKIIGSRSPSVFRPEPSLLNLDKLGQTVLDWVDTRSSTRRHNSKHFTAPWGRPGGAHLRQVNVSFLLRRTSGGTSWKAGNVPSRFNEEGLGEQHGTTSAVTSVIPSGSWDCDAVLGAQSGASWVARKSRV